MNTESSRGLLYLMGCGLKDRQPEEALLQELDPEELYRQARRHSVTALVCTALEGTAVFRQAGPEIRQKFLDRRNQAICRAMLFDAERRAVSDRMEALGIWHVALKGSLLQNLYPKYGSREMADVDMLIDPAKRETTRELFVSRGYRVESYGEDIHDVYIKAPVYDFEIHDRLFQSCYPVFSEYYGGIRERLLPAEGRRFELRFSPEDFYVFFEAHAYKHYHLGGTGVRTLGDQYILDHRMPGLDRAYVDRELERLGILAYARKSRSLAEKLFGGETPRLEDLTGSEREALDYCLGSNTYGTAANAMRNRLQDTQKDPGPITGATKFRYLMGRLFPGRETIREVHPLIYRCPVLLPFYWVWRLAAKGLGHWRRNRTEWSRVKQAK